jgi:hypothetical protein
MEKLDLSKNQKKKLMEMLKKLFPEYRFSWYAPFTLSEAGMLVGYLEGNDSERYDDCDIFIHWFELLFCYLVGRLQEQLIQDIGYKSIWKDIPPYVSNVYPLSKDRKSKWTLYSNFHFHYPKSITYSSSHPNNPIDFLYKEFSKLKNI